MTDTGLTTFPLAEVLESTAAGKLLEDLRKLRGAPLDITGGNVSRISALCVQVLLSAAATWRADGKAFCISAPSDALREALRILGLDDGQLTASGAIT